MLGGHQGDAVAGELLEGNYAIEIAGVIRTDVAGLVVHHRWTVGREAKDE